MACARGRRLGRELVGLLQLNAWRRTLETKRWGLAGWLAVCSKVPDDDLDCLLQFPTIAVIRLNTTRPHPQHNSQPILPPTPSTTQPLWYAISPHTPPPPRLLPRCPPAKQTRPWWKTTAAKLQTVIRRE